MADRVIEDIKDRLDIVDVISGYIEVKKAGTNFKAVCPFHNEKSPSLMISPSKQIWHCFGCNEGGDIFGFVIKIENVEFKEALKMLAGRAGVVLPEFSPGQKQSEAGRERLIRINTFAAKFYHSVLLGKLGSVALQYLMDRGLSKDTIIKWQIGFAPEDYHALEQVLIKKGVTQNELVKAGVSVRGDKGNIYDRFRGRITFPIYNYTGDIIGFSARVLHSSEQSAKYVNSPETLIYNKSSVMFGLNFAKAEIRKQDAVVVVEGQMDAISCHQAGFINTVATSGTALTDSHLRILSRLTKNIIFCFDADSAGQSASRRAGEIALAQGFAVKVVNLPLGKDPDELIKKDPQAWKEAIGTAQWFIDSFMQKGLSELTPGTVEQKQYVSKTLIPMVMLLKDKIEQDHYAQKIADSFSISERAVRDMLRGVNVEKSTVSIIDNPRLISLNVSMSETNPLEKLVLAGLLVSSDISNYLPLLSVDDFTNVEIKGLIQQILEKQEVPDSVKTSVLAKEAQFMLESQVDLGNGDAILANELQKNLYLLRLSNVKRQQTNLALSLKQAENSGESNSLQLLREQFSQLSSLRLQLENKINQN